MNPDASSPRNIDQTQIQMESIPTGIHIPTFAELPANPEQNSKDANEIISEIVAVLQKVGKTAFENGSYTLDENSCPALSHLDTMRDRRINQDLLRILEVAFDKSGYNIKVESGDRASIRLKIYLKSNQPAPNSI